MNSLLPELLAAHRTARTPDLHAALVACGMRQTGGPVWGVDFVTVDGEHYAPDRDGKPAIIVPFVEDGGVIDLTATGLQTRAFRTRCGLGTILGQRWVDHARETETALRLFSDPIEWLCHGQHGAVVIDWRGARLALADVPAIACSSPLLAKRVDKAMHQPVQMLFIREDAAHAAA